MGDMVEGRVYIDGRADYTYDVRPSDHGYDWRVYRGDSEAILSAGLEKTQDKAGAEARRVALAYRQMDEGAL